MVLWSFDDGSSGWAWILASMRGGEVPASRLPRFLARNGYRCTTLNGRPGRQHEDTLHGGGGAGNISRPVYGGPSK